MVNNSQSNEVCFAKTGSLSGLLAGLLVLASYGSAQADEALNEACIAAGGFPVSGGVHWPSVNAQTALEACEKATRSRGASGEVWAALGRVYHKAGYCSSYNNSKCQLAFKAYQTSANMGAAEGYFGVGYHHKTGDGGVKINYDKALINFEKAIVKKKMGLAYYYKSEIQKDLNREAWKDSLLLAAEQGTLIALAEAGEYYVKGTAGFEKEFSKGLAMLEKAAKSDNVLALNTLGDFYYYGKYLPENNELAEQYYRRGVKQESGYAAYSLGYIYKNGYLGQPDREKAKKYILLGYKWGSCNASLTEVGDIYLEEVKGQKADLAEARKWYEKAASESESAAIVRLVTMHRHGLGVPVDDEKADQLAAKLAETPEHIASYFDGDGPNADLEEDEVIYIHQKAADAGSAAGYAFLAKAYDSGFGRLDISPERAVRAWLISVILGGANSQGEISIPDYLDDSSYRFLIAQTLFAMKARGLYPDQTAKKFNPHLMIGDLYSNDKLRNQRVAFLKEPVSKNWTDPLDGGLYSGHAFYDIASHYHIESDYEKFIQWNRRCADAGHPVCITNMTAAYLHGIGLEKNIDKAREWNRRSGNSSNGYSIAFAGEVYEHDRLGAPDLEKAVEHYKRSAETGHPRGQSNLAYMYSEGRGVEKSLEKAFHWYSKAAEQGQGRGMFGVGVFYDNGYYVEKDEQVAVSFFKKARTAGYQPAIDLLKKRGIN